MRNAIRRANFRHYTHLYNAGEQHRLDVGLCLAKLAPTCNQRTAFTLTNADSHLHTLRTAVSNLYGVERLQPIVGCAVKWCQMYLHFAHSVRLAFFRCLVLARKRLVNQACVANTANAWLTMQLSRHLAVTYKLRFQPRQVTYRVSLGSAFMIDLL